MNGAVPPLPSICLEGMHKITFPSFANRTALLWGNVREKCTNFSCSLWHQSNFPSNLFISKYWLVPFVCWLQSGSSGTGNNKSLMGRIATIISYIFHTNWLSFTSPSIVNGLQHGGKLYVRAELTIKRAVFYASSVFTGFLRFFATHMKFIFCEVRSECSNLGDCS
jgi:hypothetical protein